MAKTINQILKKIPDKERTTLTFITREGKEYIVTRGKDAYYLYEHIGSGYKYLKSRAKDPCFPECY